MGFGLAYLPSTLAQSRSKGQGHAHFRIERGNGERYGENEYCHEIASHVWAFDWHIRP